MNYRWKRIKGVSFAIKILGLSSKDFDSDFKINGRGEF
jgi:hypothetical protein